MLNETHPSARHPLDVYLCERRDDDEHSKCRYFHTERKRLPLNKGKRTPEGKAARWYFGTPCKRSPFPLVCLREALFFELREQNFLSFCEKGHMSWSIVHLTSFCRRCSLFLEG